MEKSANSGRARNPRAKWVGVGVAVLALLLLLLLLRRCEKPAPSAPPPAVDTLGRGPGEWDLSIPYQPPLGNAPASAPPADTAAPPSRPAPAADTALPYVYADPWGGRHFDSVRVTLHCRLPGAPVNPAPEEEGCVLIFSLEDSLHFKSYQEPFTFRRNATLWIAGIDSLNRQTPATRIEYVIERNPGACRANAMPVSLEDRTVCMDVYEWPNREDEIPRAFVSQKDAADSCRQAGKRLCRLEEWRTACQGPDAAAYPYGVRYNEKHCPSKEAAASRSGRHPACRSYYGLFDMTGNVWEWTSTPSPDRPDFYMVAGGNWNAGNEAVCSLAKFSFYPQVSYPFVGFRCCSEPKGMGGPKTNAGAKTGPKGD